MARERMLDDDMTVEAIMRRWPAAVPVMARYRMLCIGCPVGAFHTISDACAEHGLDEEAVVAELMQAIGPDR